MRSSFPPILCAAGAAGAAGVAGVAGAVLVNFFVFFQMFRCFQDGFAFIQVVPQQRQSQMCNTKT